MEGDVVRGRERRGMMRSGRGGWMQERWHMAAVVGGGENRANGSSIWENGYGKMGNGLNGRSIWEIESNLMAAVVGKMENGPNGSRVYVRMENGANGSSAEMEDYCHLLHICHLDFIFNILWDFVQRGRSNRMACICEMVYISGK